MYAFNDKILVVDLDDKTFETFKPPIGYYKKIYRWLWAWRQTFHRLWRIRSLSTIKE